MRQRCFVSIDEGLDRALRVCRGIATTDPAVALLFAQLGEPRLRAGLAVLLDRRLVAHDALRRFLVHGPGDVNPDVVCARAAARLGDTLRSVEGGLAAFLADGPRFHPRFAMLARDIETLAPAGRGAPGEGGELASRMRLIADGLRDHFLNDKGEPRTRWSVQGVGRRYARGVEAAPRPGEARSPRRSRRISRGSAAI